VRTVGIAWVSVVIVGIGINGPWWAWLGFGCLWHYDRPLPLPFVEDGDCELVLLSASNRALSIFSISARDAIWAERLSLLVRISLRSGSSWVRIGVISA